MININLVIKPPPRLSWRRVGLTVAVGAAIFGYAAYVAIWLIGYQKLGAQLNEIGQLEAAYRKVISRAPQVAERETVMQKQQAQVARIGRNGGAAGQSALLQAIFAAAPRDVSPTEIAVGKDREILISGQAATFASAMQYLRALQAVPSFSVVAERKLNSPQTGPTVFTFAASVTREVRK